MVTIREAWRLGRAQLFDSPSAALDARLLLQHVLERDHAYLIAHDNEALTDGEWAIYRHLLGRAVAHEPIPYLTGRAPFLGLDYLVTPAVLIPRPETEQLVERAIDWGMARGRLRAIDVGTGSGCMAVSLALHLPQAFVVATDVSPEALTVAKANAARHAPGKVHFALANLLDAVARGFDLIVANLPYIAGHEWTALPDGVKSYEPTIALNGGEDGLDLIRALLPQAASRLRTGGLVLMEVGWRQGEAVVRLARSAFPGARVDVLKDFAGSDRILLIET